jgi:hypothetical protein
VTLKGIKMSDQNAPKMGAPTKYTPDVPNQLLDYFSTIRIKTFMGKDFPEINSIEGFCARIKVSKTTFHKWVKKYPDLMNAYETIKNNQADQLFFLTSNRIISESYGKLLTTNCTDIKERNETSHSVSDDTKKLIIDMGN